MNNIAGKPIIILGLVIIITGIGNRLLGENSPIGIRLILLYFLRMIRAMGMSGTMAPKDLKPLTLISWQKKG